MNVKEIVSLVSGILGLVYMGRAIYEGSWKGEYSHAAYWGSMAACMFVISA